MSHETAEVAEFFTGVIVTALCPAFAGDQKELSYTIGLLLQGADSGTSLGTDISEFTSGAADSNGATFSADAVNFASDLLQAAFTQLGWVGWGELAVGFSLEGIGAIFTGGGSIAAQEAIAAIMTASSFATLINELYAEEYG